MRLTRPMNTSRQIAPGKAYQVPRAIALYKKWSGGDKVAAIMGWGTADTEALTGFLAQDKIPDISGSYAAALTDPEGTRRERSM